jgi:hypothetical protein
VLNSLSLDEEAADPGMGRPACALRDSVRKARSSDSMTASVVHIRVSISQHVLAVLAAEPLPRLGLVVVRQQLTGNFKPVLGNPSGGLVQ